MLAQAREPSCFHITSANWEECQIYRSIFLSLVAWFKWGAYLKCHMFCKGSWHATPTKRKVLKSLAPFLELLCAWEVKTIKTCVIFVLLHYRLCAVNLFPDSVRFGVFVFAKDLINHLTRFLEKKTRYMSITIILVHY